MSIKEIIKIPNPFLKVVAKPVIDIDENILSLLDDMLETMYDANGIGLAATQIAIDKRLIVMDCGKVDFETENLTEEEKEDRAMFAYEACVISKERLFPTDVFRRFGWDENEARDFSNNAGFALEFQRLLFSRVVPNLSRIGLLTDKVRPLYDKLGVLEFESHSTDGDISWAELEKPLDLTG